MKQQHHPKDTKLYSKGANRDIDDELLSLSEGDYIDANNMRSTDDKGDAEGLKKIYGNELLYPNIDNSCENGTGLPFSTNYECIGMVEVNDNIVEFWADKTKQEPSFIRTNGIIVLKHEDFPITTDFPLQIHKNESCIGGEVYITDNNVPPMIFNIKDLLLNSGIDFEGEKGECTPKYFSGFNLSEHLLILEQPIDHPVFIKLTSSSSGISKVLGSGGMPVGYYSYAIRYVSNSGDRTNWSVATPQIPVPMRATTLCSPTFPNSQTYSKAADISSPSTLGIHIRFRVNNDSNYDYIEIKRNSWNTEAAKGAPPIVEIIGQVDIDPQERSIYDVLDMGAEAEEVLTPQEANSEMAAIERAKAIRYFNNRLYLMNIGYGSKDITEDVEIIDEDLGTSMFPAIHKMGKDGHYDPHKYTYYKSYMQGEKYGFGLVVLDAQGNLSFARKINGFENYQLPNRRDPVSADTRNVSYNGLARAATTNIITVDETHEIFDLADAVTKSDKCSYKNILTNGKKSANKLEQSGCPSPSEDGVVEKGFVKAEKVGYKPFTPVSQQDSDCGGLDYIVNTRVGSGGGSKPEYTYNPKGFAPNYYSLGMAIKGIKKLPVWGKAFSMVRTKPAQKVVAQGLGWYAMVASEGGLNAGAGKETDTVWFYSPDIDPNIGIDPLLADEIQNNPQNFEIQLVSPLGFFSEVYNFNDQTFGGNVAVDMISYARIIRDIDGAGATINPNENPNMGIPDGAYDYVAYAKWRSNSFQNLSVFTNGGNTTFQIAPNGFTQITEGRGNYFKIQLTQNIYKNGYAQGKSNHDDPDVQNWHEPVYIINIIRKNADVPDTNTTDFIPTGHYQKVEAIIGQADTNDEQDYLLVDERWEDCIDTVNLSPNNPYASLYKFLYVIGNDKIQRAWLNVTNQSASFISNILNTLQTNGVAQVTDSSGTYDIYGVYTHFETLDNTAPEYFVKFKYSDTTIDRKYQVPEEGSIIKVLYDNRVPIRFWGGDISIGENVFAPLDKQYDKNADPVDSNNEFKWQIGMPYRRYLVNPRVLIPDNTSGIFTSKIQDNNIFEFAEGNNGIQISKLRQYVAVFTASSRNNMNYGYNLENPKAQSEQAFPRINYIMRPNKYDEDKFGTGNANDIYNDNVIDLGYKDDYGDEWQLWGWGGFRFLPQTNIDYCKDDNSIVEITSVPKVGFKEQNDYCTRIVWSEYRDVNVQDASGVRTFPASNFFDISDDTGEIKFAWDDISSKGINLYAITDSGVCLLLIDKRIIHEINANELATIGSDIGGILGQLWINKQIGMNDEFWRSAAEYSNMLFFCNKNSAYLFTDNNITDIGRQAYHSKLYYDYLKDFGEGYTDKVTGVYNIINNEYWVTFNRGDKNRLGGTTVYHSLNTDLFVMNKDFDVTPQSDDRQVGLEDNDVLIVNEVIQSGNILLGGTGWNLLTKPIAICNPEGLGQSLDIYFKNQLLVTINEGECYCFTPIANKDEGLTFTFELCYPFGKPYEHPTLMYSLQKERFLGTNDQNFDRYISFNNLLYGAKNVETHELEKGLLIDGLPINGYVINASALPQPADKEFIRIRINSNNKPEKIEFFSKLDELLSGNIQSIIDTNIDPLALKDYFGYENYVPRKQNQPFDRMQGRILIFKIIHNKEEEFKITSTEVQYKPLK